VEKLRSKTLLKLIKVLKEDRVHNYDIKLFVIYFSNYKIRNYYLWHCVNEINIKDNTCRNVVLTIKNCIDGIATKEELYAVVRGLEKDLYLHNKYHLMYYDTIQIVLNVATSVYLDYSSSYISAINEINRLYGTIDMDLYILIETLREDANKKI
jgi:hypothetical protein